MSRNNSGLIGKMKDPETGNYVKGDYMTQLSVLPTFSLSYFDIKSGSYKTIKSEPYKLHVEQGKGGSGSSPVVSNFSNKESVKYLGKDIRYLKTKGFSFIEGGDGIFFGSFMYYLCYIVPAILFIVFFFIYRKQMPSRCSSYPRIYQ